ncbi:MAG: hypothetical protein JSR39_10975, partial [Verrucomicrobia bacterium]|nr:hypothetical protein [Verrucomicrobiota bacterium]
MVTRAISGVFEPISNAYDEVLPFFSEVSREISPYIEPITDGCDNIFIEPFRQGYYNLRDAAVGTKAASVA